jgi:hypothetical protein
VTKEYSRFCSTIIILVHSRRKCYRDIFAQRILEYFILLRCTRFSKRHPAKPIPPPCNPPTNRSQSTRPARRISHHQSNASPRGTGLWEQRKTWIFKIGLLSRFGAVLYCNPLSHNAKVYASHGRPPALFLDFDWGVCPHTTICLFTDGTERSGYLYHSLWWRHGCWFII